MQGLFFKNCNMTEWFVGTPSFSVISSCRESGRESGDTGIWGHNT